MPEDLPILEEVVATDFSKDVFIFSVIRVADDEPKLSVFYEISDRQNDQNLLSLELKFEASNPIWIVSFDPSYAAGAYGICLANKLAHATYDKVRACYKKVGDTNRDISIMERMRLTARCLGGEAPALKKEALKALKECLTFGIVTGGS